MLSSAEFVKHDNKICQPLALDYVQFHATFMFQADLMNAALAGCKQNYYPGYSTTL